MGLGAGVGMMFLQLCECLVWEEGCEELELELRDGGARVPHYS